MRTTFVVLLVGGLFIMGVAVTLPAFQALVFFGIPLISWRYR